MKQKNKMNNSDLDILKEEKRREVEKRELENAYQKIFFMEK